MVQLIPVKTRLEPLPPAPAAPWRPDGRTVIGAVLLAGAAGVGAARWWTGSGYSPVLAGLPDPGPVTALGLPIAQYLHELAAVAVVGLLFLRCIAGRAGDGAGGRHLAAVTAAWAWVWAAGTLAWIVFTMSDLIGVPVWKLGGQVDLIVIVSGTNRVLSETATFWVALAVAMFGARARRRPAATALLVLAAAALLPAALTGHASHHASPVLASFALAVHVVAAAVWVGALLALVVHLRAFPAQLAETLPRFSTAAVICVVAVGVSGIGESMLTLNGWATLWETNRGHLIVAKAVALVALTIIGYLHRRRTVGAACSGRLLPLLRLAAVELVLMGVTIGIAVALSTTP